MFVPATTITAAALMLTVASEARAQTPARARSFELSVGAVWTGGSSLGRAEATETRNQIGGDRFTLFAASTEIDPGAGGEARLAFYLTPTIAVEAGGLFARQRLVTRITNDVEGIPDVTAREDFTDYIVDGAIALHVGEIGRIRPLVRAGFGYLRRLHEDGSLVETGRAYHAGGGATLWLSSNRKGFVKGLGLRGDGRVVARQLIFRDVRDPDARIRDDWRAGAAVTGALVVSF